MLRTRGDCGCPAPMVRTPRRPMRTPPHPTRVHARSRRPRDPDPVELRDGGGSCRPFLKVEKDPERFAACNAMADRIGPLNDPKKVARFLEEALGREIEEVFGVLTVDIHGRLKGYTETGRGEASSVMAPMLPTLRAAIMSGGGGSVLWHLHPSGIEAEPSDADNETTEAFAEAFETIGMPLLDHVILGGDAKRRSYYSYAEEGLL